MLALENADEILQILDRFTKQKSKDIPPELEDYISYVAKTGDTVYRWPTVQYLFREKLRNVIKDFHDTTASIEDLPQCPNVDQFNYESMKTLLFERFDNFQAAPFTMQRLCELLTDPKKHYSRLDKFMRALEKNILVVSTVEPGRKPNDDSDHLQANGDISADIMSEIELLKNENKLSTNGTTEKKQNDIKAEELIAKAEVASSSGISSTVTTAEAKVKETEIDTKVESVEAAVEKPAQSATVTSEAEPQTSNDEEMPEAPKPSVDETVETKPIEQEQVAAADKPEEIDTTTPEKPESKEGAEIVDDQTEKIEIDSKPEVEAEVTVEKAKEEVVPREGKPVDEGVKEAVPAAEEVKNTPPTPKRAASACDDDDEENGGDEDGDSAKNPSAKKIKLDLEPSELKTPEVESTTISDVDVDLDKEADILDSISTEIDAQKESELLEEVDTALTAAKDPINIDVQPIAEGVVLDAEAVLNSVESTPATDLLKSDEPVAIPADLDFTPDEALSELVSSDILAAVIPEQPAEEVKEVKVKEDEPAKITEPTETAAPEQTPTPAEVVVPAVVVADADTAVIDTTSTATPATEVVAAADDATPAAPTATATAPVVDEMNVENTEAASTVEAENAMEEAPIKADEEQMDVDESNSTDAMDL